MDDARVQTVLAVEAASGEAVSSDKTSLEDIYDVYAAALYRYALALTDSPEDAEDAVQEVFVRIARNRRGFDRAQSRSAYLFASVRNAAYSVLRRRRKRGELHEGLLCEAQCSTETGGQDMLDLEIVRGALAGLPRSQREAVVLKVFEQMTFREIAEISGESINTVASRYRYGIAAIRKALEDREDGR